MRIYRISVNTRWPGAGYELVYERSSDPDTWSPDLIEMFEIEAESAAGAKAKLLAKLYLSYAVYERKKKEAIGQILNEMAGKEG